MDPWRSPGSGSIITTTATTITTRATLPTLYTATVSFLQCKHHSWEALDRKIGEVTAPEGHISFLLVDQVTHKVGLSHLLSRVGAANPSWVTVMHSYVRSTKVSAGCVILDDPVLDLQFTRLISQLKYTKTVTVLVLSGGNFQAYHESPGFGWLWIRQMN